MYSTPSIFIPKMLARKFSSVGISLCPAPCRARNATRFPRSVPIRYGPDGSPNGVSTFFSSRSVSSSMSYKPLPPMMPMVIASLMSVPAPSYQLSAISYQLSAFSFQLSAFSFQLSAPSYWFHVVATVLLSDDSRRDHRIVLEEHHVLTLDGFFDEGAFEFQRLHRIEIVGHDP